jgi:hypothetical protein
MIRRTPLQVAQRTLVLGAIAFRASLEATNDPRVVQVSLQVVPWLNRLNCDNQLDPLERELLDTPVGQLSDSQKVDANWSGEAASFFGWTLSLSDPLPVMGVADQSALLNTLGILKPKACEVIRQAVLRDHQEIEDACQQIVLIRSLLQETRIDQPFRHVIRQVNLNRLAEAGLTTTEEGVSRASKIVDTMTPEERKRAVGSYFVRDHAAFWLFSDRHTYFEVEEEEIS